MIERLFILGAKDPEMERIENILKNNNQAYIYASIDNKRCHPGNTYKANNILELSKEYIYIECEIDNNENNIYLDHHKKGDFGYDLNYTSFLEASSLGQLLAYLIKNNIYKSKVADFYTRAFLKGFMFFKEENSWYFKKSENEYIKIHKKDVLIAAGDHSLSEAYKGLCAGVSKENILDERIIEISYDFNGDYELVQDTMNKYSKYFKVKTDEIIDLRALNLGVGYSIDYLCLRELAIKEDQQIVVTTKDSEESKERVMFFSLRKEEVEKLLIEKRYLDFNIEKIFGVPNRGYIGGYLRKGNRDKNL